MIHGMSLRSRGVMLPRLRCRLVCSAPQHTQPRGDARACPLQAGRNDGPMALLRDHLKKAGVVCVGPFIFPHHHFSVQTAKNG
jgi:hypothetical protein